MRRRLGTLVLAGALTLTGCSLLESAPDPADTASDLAAALAVGDFSGVPLASPTAAEAAEEWTGILTDLEDVEREVTLGEVTRDEERATATLRWTWDLGTGEAWAYETTGQLALVDDEWRATWEPSLVEPSLQPGDVLELAALEPKRAPVVDGAGRPLVVERPVSRVGIDKTRVSAQAAPRSARRLAQAAGLEVAAYVDRVRDAGDKAFVEAIVYRKDEVPPEVLAVIRTADGAVGIADSRPLAPTRTFAAPLLGRVGEVTAEMIEERPDLYEVGDLAGTSGLLEQYDEQLRGRPGLAVRAVPADPGEPERDVHVVPATDGEPLRLTLDSRLQAAAEEVLADVAPASALVAIRPSTGGILAAANGPGTDGLNLATTGQFAPGSTFKIVSALALMRSGLRPDGAVSCPAERVVDGRAFQNYPDYPSAHLGEITLREAVAQSCNTAFLGAYERIGGTTVADTAASLGFGGEHEAGFPSFYGSVEPDDTATGTAAQLIGQGTVLASPMAMAAVIGSVAAGRTVLPRLVQDVEPASSAQAAPLRPGEATALREMLRAVVTEGSGGALADLPGEVIAKTGTAEWSDEGTIRNHAWMVAARGDLAVAVFVHTGESGSRTAGPLVEEFLRAVG